MYSMFVAALLILSLVRVSDVHFSGRDYQGKLVFFKPVIDSLLKKGVDTNFIFSLLANSGTHFSEKFVKINVSGYLKQEMGNPVTRTAITKCRNFINQNSSSLANAENQYGVPKEVITSILWIETKLGAYLGNNQVASVFLSTAMANRQEFINLNLNFLHDEFEGDTIELKELEKKIYSRAKSKADWAIKEIISLNKMSKQFSISVQDLYGSWAGAFGIPQFLPSSYLQWAVDGNGDGKVNLFNMDDAIFSVGNYLKAHGWGAGTDAQKNAVYGYNNSWDYVEGVLKLASRLKYHPPDNENED